MKTRNTSSKHHSSKIIKLLMLGFARVPNSIIRGLKTCTMLCIGTITLLLTINPLSSTAQNGDPPPPPGEHGQNGNQIPGGGAPIGDGLLILLALGTVYGLRKGLLERKLKKTFVNE